MGGAAAEGGVLGVIGVVTVPAVTSAAVPSLQDTNGFGRCGPIRSRSRFAFHDLRARSVH